jgi:hypothetical protein
MTSLVSKVPEIAVRAVQATLETLDPEELIFSRDAAKLKLKWYVMLSSFTIAYKGWSSSGQGDLEAFSIYC